MTKYAVYLDDNYHYQDPSERITHGVFDTADEATAACQTIVDAFLIGAFEPGMSSKTLWDAYVGFGDDPFIVPLDRNDKPAVFSAWTYARERCEAMVQGNVDR